MDPISDMLVALKNAQAVYKETVKIPFSKIKYEICKILEKKGFVEEVKVRGRKKKIIIVKLKYDGKVPAISGVRKISKPGQRIYISAKEIKPSKSGYGIFIISTSKGLLTDKEAKKLNVGGELLCEIW